MSYFADHYAALRFPIAEDGRSGFRLAQIAAIHALSAHFFSSKQPAIVAMPTGAGKTTVLMAVAFLLRAGRILVLTPSRLVREQIAENFRALADLKKVKALPLELQTPKVFATDRMIGSEEEWENLREYDVVVATVPSVSREGVIPEPPPDLFDVVLVDEAHHAPARTWSRLLNLLQEAKQILFTATPFRRDDKEIKGKFVFNYDLRRARQDRVFGDIAFQPVDRRGAPSIDIAIAHATEAKFTQDRAAALDHLVMIRADTLTRAKELQENYERNTRLRLAFVNGQHSLGHVKRIIAKLRARELDGIVCVNMFGEGFNLPNLKIAAVHSPHKSLAVTLQFIGRFARTGQANIGGATFLAEPTSSSAEIKELYEAHAIWRDIVQNLAGVRIESEIHARDVLDSFAVQDVVPDMDDFSLYTVRPYFHAKLFAAPDAIDLAITPDFPDKLQVIYKGLSDPHGAAVYLTRESVRSPWSSDERFTNVAYDIFIFYHNRDANLLFICASRRHANLYTRLARELLGGRPRPLSHSSINRALNDLDAAEFFNVGMRKRHQLGRVESYRMIAGPSADKAIQEADGRLFGRGHCFGKAIEDGNEITIGVSSASKVWSNTYDRIPELLQWCDGLAEKIASGHTTATGSRLDLLSPGDELDEVPAGVIAMTWGLDVYLDPPPVFYHRADGTVATVDLLDFDLEIVRSDEGNLIFQMKNTDIEWNGRFSLGAADLFEVASDDEPTLTVHVHNEDISIIEFLNEETPSFYCADLSRIEGTSVYRMPTDLDPFGNARFEIVDWAATGVDIRKEKPDGTGGRSIFEWLQERLVASDAAVVFCDDGPGEIADFISIAQTDDGPRVAMFHCKASGSDQPGNRVADLYEVCGQAVKSSVWFRPEQLLARLKHRTTRPRVRGYVKGDQTEASRILAQPVRQQAQFSIYVVQPGVMRDNRSGDLSNLLAATSLYLIQGGIEVFGVIGS
jgi:superfamily II DNA or RNA helicase